MVLNFKHYLHLQIKEKKCYDYFRKMYIVEVYTYILNFNKVFSDINVTNVL